MNQTLRNERAERIVFCLVVFLAMLVFFTALHPIPIMDEDDVIYTVLSRPAIPIPGFWNPSRMLPEVLMPLCGNLAALAAGLGCGTFIDCQVFFLGAMLSGFVTAYLYAFRMLLERRFRTGRFAAVCLSVLFLLLHFLIFRTDYSRNLYMFYSYDACCVFYYTIPALLSCTLVLYLMADPDETPLLTGKKPLGDSILVLALYGAVFSNLFGSVILAVYAGCRVLRDLVGMKKKHLTTKTVLKADALLIAVVLFWLVAVILEATGGRANNAVSAAADGSMALIPAIGTAAATLGKRLVGSSLLFRLMLAACMVCGAAGILIRPDKAENSRFLHAGGAALISGLLSAVFIIVLSAAANPDYAGRPQVIFPIVFSVFLLMILAIAFVIRRVPKTALLLPIALLFVFSMINTRFLTFADSNPLFIDGKLAVKIENDIYGKITEAAKAGETEVTVQVPKSWDPVANWPHNANIGNPIAQFFLKYGIIDHEIMVTTEPSDEYNEAFGIHPDVNRIY